MQVFVFLKSTLLAGGRNRETGRRHSEALAYQQHPLAPEPKPAAGPPSRYRKPTTFQSVPLAFFGGTFVNSQLSVLQLLGQRIKTENPKCLGCMTIYKILKSWLEIKPLRSHRGSKSCGYGNAWKDFFSDSWPFELLTVIKNSFLLVNFWNCGHRNTAQRGLNVSRAEPMCFVCRVTQRPALQRGWWWLMTRKRKLALHPIVNVTMCS